MAFELPSSGRGVILSTAAHQKMLSLSKYSEAWLNLSFRANVEFVSEV